MNHCARGKRAKLFGINIYLHDITWSLNINDQFRRRYWPMATTRTLKMYFLQMKSEILNSFSFSYFINFAKLQSRYDQAKFYAVSFESCKDSEQLFSPLSIFNLKGRLKDIFLNSSLQRFWWRIYCRLIYGKICSFCFVLFMSSLGKFRRFSRPNVFEE